MVEKYIRLKELQLRIPLSTSTIYRMISQQSFPRPVRLGARAVAWRVSDVEAYLVAAASGEG